MFWHRRISAALAAGLFAAGCANLGSSTGTDKAAEVSAYERAVSYMQQGDYERATVAWERLLEDESADANALANLAIAYMQLDRQEDALEALNKALAEDPAHPEAATLLAIEHRKAGRFDEARALYTKVLERHPDYALGHLNLGILCDLYLLEPQCALEHYQRYQALTQDNEQEVAQWITDLEQRQR